MSIENLLIKLSVIMKYNMITFISNNAEALGEFVSYLSNENNIRAINDAYKIAMTDISEKVVGGEPINSLELDVKPTDSLELDIKPINSLELNNSLELDDVKPNDSLELDVKPNDSLELDVKPADSLEPFEEPIQDEPHSNEPFFNFFNVVYASIGSSSSQIFVPKNISFDESATELDSKVKNFCSIESIVIEDNGEKEWSIVLIPDNIVDQEYIVFQVLEVIYEKSNLFIFISNSIAHSFYGKNENAKNIGLFKDVALLSQCYQDDKLKPLVSANLRLPELTEFYTPLSAAVEVIPR